MLSKEVELIPGKCGSGHKKKLWKYIFLVKYFQNMLNVFFEVQSIILILQREILADNISKNFRIYR